jgi:multiple sugar transport system ATP-binding protein
MDLFLNPANIFVASFIGSPPMNQVAATIAKGENGPIATFGRQSVALAPLPQLANNVGRQVILGIRPEHVAITTGNEAGKVTIDLDLVETLGSEALVHATLQNAPFVIKTETGNNVRHLDAINGFTIDPDRIKIFDAGTGAALSGQHVAT